VLLGRFRTPEAMEVAGEYGFIRQSSIRRFRRDVEGIEFGTGTSQIQRVIISGK
jgi:alkylation response protein AidB-like acyl-CoA dehydrogenase